MTNEPRIAVVKEESIVHSDVRFERKDVRLGYVMALLTTIGVYLLVHFSVVWIIFRGGEHNESATKQSPYPLPADWANVVPSEPRLQPIDRLRNEPNGNLDAEQARLEAALHSAGPAEEKGFVRIPIEDAMKEVVSQLPVSARRTNDPALQGDYVVGPSNSGRSIHDVIRRAAP